MQLELKPANKLSYKLKLTPQMRLAIHLLQMPLVKLKDYVKQQIEENPVLEAANTEVPLKEVESDLNYSSKEDEEEKQNYRESLITKPVTLAEHLLEQLHLCVNSDIERKIGEVTIANIDDNGYLKSSIEEIAESTQATPQEVEKALSLVQTFDPVGVGARDLRECLLLQITAKGEENSLAGQIVDKYLPYLEKKRFEFIAKKLKVPLERIKEAIKEIARLEPKPGRSFNTERAVRLIPDAILRKGEKGYEAIFNDWELPRITLNAKYKNMIKEVGTPEDAKAYLKERLQAARTLIDAVQRRNETIQKVIEEIVNTQKEALDNEEINFKPMTLEQIGKRIGKHKSTVSRAVVNKYIQTSSGIVELRSFFNSGVRQINGDLLSSRAIKSKIRALIENEEKERPLTDQEIVASLKKDGISVARRTIAKYRNKLKILPSQSRRE
ncbi:MAG: RNA polymerase factor sigma-54 [Candidatus Omnitrophota bacterium]|nr:RNA polymerase factor sigma-54 [Candidatus Omnitrophota bacterium]